MSKDNGHPPDPTTPTHRPKLAERIASEIESMIVGLGWPLGHVIGSEAALLERFGVSRAVFRESVRIVEHHGVARMRRGPNGGLLVTVPDLESIQRPATLFLDYSGVSTRDLFVVRTALELKCVEIVASRMDDQIARALREAIERENQAGHESMELGTPHELHVLLATLSGNPAMGLFVTTLVRLGYERTRRLAMSQSDQDEQLHAHRRIVEALIRGDGILARKRMQTHLESAAARYPN